MEEQSAKAWPCHCYYTGSIVGAQSMVRRDGGRLAPERTHGIMKHLLGLRCLAAVGLLGALLWVIWPTLLHWNHRWANDPQYSHGYLVPGFAVVLLWLRRDLLQTQPLSWSLLGLVLLGVGAGLRLAGAYFYFLWVEHIALLPLLMGVALSVGGPTALRWSYPAIAFLAFMIPLPGRLDGALAHPLQRVGTEASTYVLQGLGVPAVADGNVILLSEGELGIVEACSGLRMLIVFIALATGVALVVRRPLLERVLIVLSSIPIAIIANVVRIASTAILHELGYAELAEVVYHDVAGWLMMVFAVGMLWVELQLFSRLFLFTPTASDSASYTSLLSAIE